MPRDDEPRSFRSSDLPPRMPGKSPPYVTPSGGRDLRETLIAKERQRGKDRDGDGQRPSLSEAREVNQGYVEKSAHRADVPERLWRSNGPQGSGGHSDKLPSQTRVSAPSRAGGGKDAPVDPNYGRQARATRITPERTDGDMRRRRDRRSGSVDRAGGPTTSQHSWEAGRSGSSDRAPRRESEERRTNSRGSERGMLTFCNSKEDDDVEEGEEVARKRTPVKSRLDGPSSVANQGDRRRDMRVDVERSGGRVASFLATGDRDMISEEAGEAWGEGIGGKGRPIEGLRREGGKHSTTDLSAQDVTRAERARSRLQVGQAHWTGEDEEQEDERAGKAGRRDRDVGRSRETTARQSESRGEEEMEEGEVGAGMGEGWEGEGEREGEREGEGEEEGADVRVEHLPQVAHSSWSGNRGG